VKVVWLWNPERGGGVPLYQIFPCASLSSTLSESSGKSDFTMNKRQINVSNYLFIYLTILK